jgi:hypothetical protein
MIIFFLKNFIPLQKYNKLLRIEPRLTAKLADPFMNLLVATTSKSLEYELVFVAIKHFSESK